MPLPTITSSDLKRALEDAFSDAPYPQTRAEGILGTLGQCKPNKLNLRDIRRCCAVLSGPEVREALDAACRSTLADLAQDGAR